jgi:small subunit ribosomal protein S18
MAFQKSCSLCEDDVEVVDYKDPELLDRFLTDRGKILPRRATGACSRHQKQLSSAIKRARYLALIPYIKDYHR